MEDEDPNFRIWKAIKKRDVDKLISLCDTEIDTHSILNFTKEGKRMIHIAVEMESVELLRKLFQIGADPKALTESSFDFQETILHTASLKGSLELVCFILHEVPGEEFKKLYSIKQTGKRKAYRNVFYFASKSRKKEVVQCLQTVGHLHINEVLPDNKTALLHLVEEFDSKGIELLCQCGANVNIGTLDRKLSAVQYASETIECPETLNILLNNGAEVDSVWIKRSKKTVLKQSPLFMALKKSFTQNAKVLIKNGANVNFVGQSTQSGYISCFILATKRCPALVPEFLEKGANPNETYQGENALMAVLAGERSEMKRNIHALLHGGADVNFVHNGKTVIQKCKDYHSLEAFISSGIKVKDIEEVHKVSTLALALKESSDMIGMDASNIMELLKNGANPNAIPEGEDSALILACKHGMVEIAEELVSRGSSLGHRGLNGNTALHVCCSKGLQRNLATINKLIEASAPLNVLNDEGNTPLFALMKTYHTGSAIRYIPTWHDDMFIRFMTCDKDETSNVVSKMLENGANPNCAKKGVNSAIMIAIRMEFMSVIESLLKAGADLAHVGENGKTALDICCAVRYSAPVRDFIFRAIVEKDLVDPMSKVIGKPILDVMYEKSSDNSLIEMALVRGADPNHVNPGDDSLLMKAIKSEKFSLACNLLDAGASFLYKNSSEQSAFDILLDKCYKSKQSIDKLFTPWLDEERSTKRKTLVKLLIKFIDRGFPVNGEKDGPRPLITAVYLGDIDAVQYILRKGGDVNIVGVDNETPLMIAALNGMIEISKLMIKAKANVNYSGFLKDYNGEVLNISILTLLLKFGRASTGLLQILKLFIESGANPNQEQSGCDSALIYAVKRLLDPEIIQFLIDSNADVNHLGNQNLTPLHTVYEDDKWACFVDDEPDRVSQILQKLLQNGASTKLKSIDGKLPLHLALENTSFEFDNVNILLDHTNEMNDTDNEGKVPIVLAAESWPAEILDRMIKLGAEVNKKDDKGNTALHVAMSRLEENVISLFLANGAFINAVNDIGQTPLVLLIEKMGSSEVFSNIKAGIDIFNLLLSHGADPNICTEGRDSLLIKAVKYELYDIVSSLLKRKVNVKHIGESRKTALHVFIEKALSRHQEYHKFTKETYRHHRHRKEKSELEKIEQDKNILEALLKAGGDVTVVDEAGNTPLSIAVKCESQLWIDGILPSIFLRVSDPNIGRVLPIVVAAEFSTKEVIEQLSDEGADLNKTGKSGDTALIAACRVFCSRSPEKMKEIVEYLLKAGASVNVLDSQGKSPLTLLLRSYVDAITAIETDRRVPDSTVKQIAIARACVTSTTMHMLQEGADPNQEPEGMDSALSLAVKGSLIVTVQQLLQAGANPNHIGEGKETVLQKFFSSMGKDFCIIDDKRDSSEILKLLLETSADINKTNKGHDPPIILAIKSKDYKALDILLATGTSPDVSKLGRNGYNALEQCLNLEKRPYYSDSIDFTVLEKILNLEFEDRLIIDFFQKFWNKIKIMKGRSRQNPSSVTLKLLSRAKIDVNIEKANTDSPLIFFCKLGSFEVVQKLLELGAEVDHIGDKNATALHSVFDNLNENSLTFLDLLLEYSPNLKIRNKEDKTVVDQALYLYNDYYYSFRQDILSKMLIKFINKGVELDEESKTKTLRTAAKRGNFSLMTELVSEGANVKDRDREQRTTLHLCWSHAYDVDDALRFMDIYVQKGGSLTDFDKYKKSPLEALLTRGGDEYMHYDDEDITDEKMSKVVEWFANHNAITHSSLFIAAKKGLKLTADVLIKSGLNPLIRNEKGKTALHVCLEYPMSNVLEMVEKFMGDATAESFHNIFGDDLLYLAVSKVENIYLEAVVRTLLHRGADPNIYQKNREPLLETVNRCHANALKCLLDTNANANVTDKRGQNALHKLYQKYGSTHEILKILLNSKVNVNAVDDEGVTPLMMAVQKMVDYGSSKNDVLEVEELVSNGAEVTIRNKENMTALDIWCKNGRDLNLAKILMNAGGVSKRSFYFAVNNSKFQDEDEFEDFLIKLLENGADPNEQDEESANLIETMRRGMLKASKALIHHGIEVNRPDKHNQTALILACHLDNAKNRSDFVKLFFENGGNLKMETKTGCTTIYTIVRAIISDIEKYELADGDEPVIRIDLELFNLLVQGGTKLEPFLPCESDGEHKNIDITKDIYEKSALYLLIKNGLFKMATFLIKAGWNIAKEAWFEEFYITKFDLETVKLKSFTCKRAGIDKMKDDFQSFIDSLEKGPKPLTVVCRESIRNQLAHVSRGREILSAIDKLPVPTAIKSFLTFGDLIQDEELIPIEWKQRQPDVDPQHMALFRTMMLQQMFQPMFPQFPTIFDAGYSHYYDSDEYYDSNDYEYYDSDEYEYY